MRKNIVRDLYNSTIFISIVMLVTKFTIPIFPPFVAAPLAHSISSLFNVQSGLVPIVVMCLMASTQAAVTRTPLATALILCFTASPKTELSVMLPGMILSSYLGVYFSCLFSKKSYFAYSD